MPWQSFRRIVAPRHHAVFAVAAASISSSFYERCHSSSSQLESRRKDCPDYGCVLLPQDVLYNASMRKSLGQIKSIRKTELTMPLSKELKASGDRDNATLTMIGYKGGSVFSQVNQDSGFCVSPFFLNPKQTVDSSNDLKMQRLVGVFDGHAPRGEYVAEYSTQQLPLVLATELTKHGVHDLLSKDKKSNHLVTTVKQCLIDTFIKVNNEAPAYPSGGCTATVVLQLHNHVFIANAGDSQSLLCVYDPHSHETHVVAKSRPDVPSLTSERRRIESSGGRVYVMGGNTPRVIYHDSSTGSNSGLAMSRSLGDWDAQRVGVIPDPLVQYINLEQDILQKYGPHVAIFCISATDGMLDYVTPTVMAQVLAPALFVEKHEHVLAACERLITMAADEWNISREGRYRDDISIAVSKLRAPSSSISSNSKSTKKSS